MKINIKKLVIGVSVISLLILVQIFINKQGDTYEEIIFSQQPKFEFTTLDQRDSRNYPEF